MVVYENVRQEELVPLLKAGFVRDEPKTLYEKLCLRKDGVRLILYTSGKLLLQGKKTAISAIAEELEKHGIRRKLEQEHFRKEAGWIIGSDETLKGDTFGGIVVAAVKANQQIRERLLELGAADSKLLSDGEVRRIAELIKREAPCSIKSMTPEQYNKVGKVTLLLNNLHHECALELAPGRHIVDKYPGCTVGDVAVTKAESKYVEVAAASILARAAGLQQLEFLSQKAGFTLPKGSTHVALALHELQARGLDFREFVKLEFNNVQEFL